MKHAIEKIALGFLVCCAAACGQSGIRDTKMVRDLPLPRPARILIHDFAVREREINEYQGIMRRQPSVKDPAERARQLARDVQDALADELTEGLRALGFEVVRVRHDVRAAADELLIEGQFLAIDEGNPLRRLAIGFGSGTSMVRSRARVYHGTNARAFMEFTTHSDSGALPGAMPALGAGAVVQGGVSAGMLATSATVSGVKNYTSDVARMAAASGDQIVRYLSEDFAARGWIGSDQVRKARIAR